MNNKAKLKNKISLIVYSVIIVGLLIYYFVQTPNINPMFADGAFFWLAVITVILLVSQIFSLKLFKVKFVNGQAAFDINKDVKISKWRMITVGLLWVIFFAVIIISLPLFNWKKYRDQMPTPQANSFNSEVQAVDINQVPIVDKDLALKLADKKLGEKPSLGSQVILGEPTIQQVNGKLIWAVPLHHSGFFKWLNNIDGASGYIVVSATNIQDVKYVENYKIKIQPNSYFFDDLKRNIRFSQNALKAITDYSFELDESGQPYWVVTTYENTCGFSLPEANGVILVNASTGDKKFYTLENIPNWVDRAQPEDFIMNQINNKGRYVHGIFNFSNKDKFQTSEGDIIVYNNNRCYLFTGITSVGSDESAIGFYMVDMVTKEPKLYAMPGATEYSAMNSAQGSVQDLGYTATFPIILNVDGNPTYFMTLKDKEGLIKQYAYVSVKDYSIVGTGETTRDALDKYRKSISNTSVKDESTTVETKELKGTIARIGSYVFEGETLYTFTLAESPTTIFNCSGAISAQLAITKEGDAVEFEYIQGEVINKVTKFTNTNFD